MDKDNIEAKVELDDSFKVQDSPDFGVIEGVPFSNDIDSRPFEDPKEWRQPTVQPWPVYDHSTSFDRMDVDPPRYNAPTKRKSQSDDTPHGLSGLVTSSSARNDVGSPGKRSRTESIGSDTATLGSDREEVV